MGIYMMSVLCYSQISVDHLHGAANVWADTVYPKKYAHGFVVLCFVVVMQSFIMNSHEVFIHIHQGCFAGTGAIVRLPQCQWSKPDGYGKISQCITTTKHSKAKTVCIFLGIYCTLATFVIICSLKGVVSIPDRPLSIHALRVLIDNQWYNRAIVNNIPIYVSVPVALLFSGPIFTKMVTRAITEIMAWSVIMIQENLHFFRLINIITTDIVIRLFILVSALNRRHLLDGSALVRMVALNY